MPEPGGYADLPGWTPERRVSATTGNPDDSSDSQLACQVSLDRCQGFCRKRSRHPSSKRGGRLWKVQTIRLRFTHWIRRIRSKGLPGIDAVKRKTKLLAIGLDAAEQSLIRPWMDSGDLPVLASLRDRAVWGRTTNEPGLYTGAVWPSIFTGVSAGRHGCFKSSGWKWTVSYLPLTIWR